MNKLRYFKKALKSLTLCVVISTTLFGCAGKSPNPVMVMQYGDESKSCDALKYEMHSMQNNMRAVLPKTEKTGKNVALGVTGLFFIVPWFFMDFSDAEQLEYESYRDRYNHLASIAVSKKCNVKQRNYPSVEEMKRAYNAKYNKK